MAYAVPTSIVLYCLCSSTMLVANKLAVAYVPVISLVNVVQFASAALFVVCLYAMGSAKIEKISLNKIQAYLLYVLAFASCIYCNMRALSLSSVETVIVFRSCAPLIVSIAEWAFLGRELPSLRSFGALILILIGAAAYVLTDNAFRLHGLTAYTWSFLYLFNVCFNLTYGKYILSQVSMASMWERVLYNNSLAIIPTLALGACLGDQINPFDVEWSVNGVNFLLLSSLIGVGLSYSGMHCQNKISATSFTIVGLANKVLTLLINQMFVAQHASFKGVLSLFLCLCGATLYVQSPLRKRTEYEQVSNKEDTELQCKMESGAISQEN